MKLQARATICAWNFSFHGPVDFFIVKLVGNCNLSLTASHCSLLTDAALASVPHPHFDKEKIKHRARSCMLRVKEIQICCEKTGFHILGCHFSKIPQPAVYIVIDILCRLVFQWPFIYQVVTNLSLWSPELFEYVTLTWNENHINRATLLSWPLLKSLCHLYNLVSSLCDHIYTGRISIATSGCEGYFRECESMSSCRTSDLTHFHISMFPFLPSMCKKLYRSAHLSLRRLYFIHIFLSAALPPPFSFSFLSFSSESTVFWSFPSLNRVTTI